MSTPRNAQRLLAQLPDQPRWVETRAALRAGCVLFGGGNDWIVLDEHRELATVVGCPCDADVRAAAARLTPEAEILADPQLERRLSALLGLSAEPVRLHTRNDESSATKRSTVTWLRPTQDLSHIRGDLLEELEDALSEGLVAASFVDGLPVSFCYAGSVTERWWDVAIDTLEPFRRQGRAAATFEYMATYFATQGQRPVWGAVESNPASWRLADKLGFRQVDSLIIFELPER